ncbi:MAG: DUF952 domain-containing protein [Alphaproteobacteria bacterium]
MSNSAWKVFRIAEWESLMRDGRFSGSGGDLRDGYIHLSSADQLARTLEKHFAGETAVIVGEVELAPFGEALRWELSAGGSLFPHLYAPLHRGAIVRATRYARSLRGLEPAGEVAVR